MNPLLTAATPNWQLSDFITGQKGQKLASITQNGKTPQFQLCLPEHPLPCPFGISAFQDEAATRLNCDVNLGGHPELLAKLSEIDAWAQSLSQGPLPSLIYSPLVATNPAFGTSRLRIKVGTVGLNKARFWHPERTRIEDVKSMDTRGCNVVPVVSFPRIWIMQKQWGIVCEMRDAILECPTDTCPI